MAKRHKGKLGKLILVCEIAMSVFLIILVILIAVGLVMSQLGYGGNDGQ